MPHHSGGGSHSGGSHHSRGSHHSSGKSNLISKKPFINSRKYRYYDKNGSPHYIYSTQMPKKMGISDLFPAIFIFSMFLIGGILITGSYIKEFKPLEPLTPVYEAPDLHIEDHIGAIENNSSLEKVLKDFEELTGISPYIITVYDSEWKDRSVDLIDYSYYLYVNHFEDEQHFLIVYSEPENADELSFVDWRWEAMQGDETDPIITEENFKRFQTDLQEGLTRNSTSIEEAIEDAFTNSLEYMMVNPKNISTEFSGILFLIIWFSIIILAMIPFIRNYILSGKDYEEVTEENAGNGYGTNMSGGGYILNGEYYKPPNGNNR